MNTGLRRGEAAATAFRSAAEAWFWTMGALRARREGANRSGSSVKRPCDPDDVVLCLDRLYRDRRIDRRHAQVMRVWGERQLAPDAQNAAAQDAMLWGEAIGRLEDKLRVKGIVA